MPVSTPKLVSRRMQRTALAALATPFAAAGLFAAFLTAHNVANGTLPLLLAPVVGGCALLFVGVGVALIVAGVQGRKRQEQLASLQAAFPDSPWMWREDWAQARCDSRLKTTVLGAWVVAILWNAVCVPVVYFTLTAVWEKGLQKNPVILMAFLFPLAGAGMLMWAVRSTLRRVEFGKTSFTMSPVPGVIGGRLRGNIQARFPHGAARGVQLKLSCINRMVTGSGKNRTVWEKILWRDEHLVRPETLMPGPDGTLIPVEFPIPADALACDSSNPNDAILWLLEADADVPGVNYQDTFEVPVFRTKDSPATAPVDRKSAFAEVPEGPVERPSGSKIIVQPSPSGGVMFRFPPARDVGAALGTTAFFLLWTAIVYFLWTRAPIFFTIVFGLFDVLMMVIVLRLWLGESIMVIEAGTVTVRRGLLALGPAHVVPCSEISEIRISIGMQTGNASGTPYYDIELTRRDGAKILAGRGISNKLEAEWLLSEMKKATGLPTHAAAASAR